MSLLHTITTAFVITVCDLPGTWINIVPNLPVELYYNFVLWVLNNKACYHYKFIHLLLFNLYVSRYGVLMNKKLGRSRMHEHPDSASQRPECNGPAPHCHARLYDHEARPGRCVTDRFK